jgi:hypothetical protein
MTNRGKEQILGIREQELHDPVSGAAFKFVIAPGTSAPSRIYFKSSHGVWREFCFDENGEFVRASTKTASPPQSPGRLRLVK